MFRNSRNLALRFLLAFGFFIGQSGAAQDSTALIVTHAPTPAPGHFSETSDTYKWFYDTEVTNSLDFPLKVVRFGVAFKQLGVWSLPEDRGEVFGNAEFVQWYGSGDSLPDGWLPAGKAAKVKKNWNTWSSAVPAPTKWVYTAVDSLGNEYHGYGIVDLQSVPVPVLHGTMTYPTTFLYKQGDNPAWAESDFDDNDWFNMPLPGRYPESSSAGIRWLRIHLEVDSSLHDIPLGLTVNCHGATEIYIDGMKVFQRGDIGPSIQGELPVSRIEYPKPTVVTFRKPENASGQSYSHVLAIRHSTYFLEGAEWSGKTPDINFIFGDYQVMSDGYVELIRKISFHQMLLMGIFLAFALIHLLLYVYYPAIKANLYFSLISLVASLFVFTFFQDRFFAENAFQELWLVRVGNSIVGVLLLAMLRFVYEITGQKVPRYFLLLVGAVAIFLIYNWMRPFQASTPGLMIVSLCLIEIVRTIIRFRRKKAEGILEGAWIILLGMGAVLLGATYQILVFDLDLFPAFWTIADFPVLFYSALLLMLSMSVVLSKNYARTNTSLEAKLIEVKALSEKNLRQERERMQLEAENLRKTRELEEARQLQLSMLPESPPVLPDLEIAAYMAPATEVGGDYYDFKLHDDGSLTIAIGDATGHGMNAGTMVAATKALFSSLVDETDPANVLKKSTRAIKKMGLKKMFMALTVAKVKDKQMRIAAAGMPYALVYRAASCQVEEIELKGMPLGSFVDFPYKAKECKLDAGDIVLFMSDGLEEMFNHEGEIFGDDRIKHCFKEAVLHPASKIIDILKVAGKDWANGRAQEDDVTLVVIKLK